VGRYKLSKANEAPSTGAKGEGCGEGVLSRVGVRGYGPENFEILHANMYILVLFSGRE